jgi:hypothetical protein
MCTISGVLKFDFLLENRQIQIKEPHAFERFRIIHERGPFVSAEFRLGGIILPHDDFGGGQFVHRIEVDKTSLTRFFHFEFDLGLTDGK